MTTTSIQILGIGSRVNHPSYGLGAIMAVKKVAYEVCFMEAGIKPVLRSYDQWEIIEAIEGSEDGVSYTEAEKSLIKILKQYNAIEKPIALGDKWNNGTMILKPNDPSLKPKEISLEAFFHKIVMVRDRLRVMEQRINSSSNLNDEEKVNLQQYLTRIYGSLTTFNVLFKYKEDSFVGDRK